VRNNYAAESFSSDKRIFSCKFSNKKGVCYFFGGQPSAFMRELTDRVPNLSRRLVEASYEGGNIKSNQKTHPKFSEICSHLA
jgi:hypothetical protein